MISWDFKQLGWKLLLLKPPFHSKLEVILETLGSEQKHRIDCACRMNAFLLSLMVYINKLKIDLFIVRVIKNIAGLFLV